MTKHYKLFGLEFWRFKSIAYVPQRLQYQKYAMWNKRYMHKLFIRYGYWTYAITWYYGKV